MLKSIQQQEREQAKVQSWQQQQHRDIDRKAEELRRKQREEASKAEQQAQAEIAKAEKAIATARKQRALGVEPDLAGLKANKEKAIESQKQELSKAKEAKTELQKAEKEAKAEVETIAKEATTELEAQQRLAMAEVAKLQEDNVELDNGEWIDKETYNSLSPEDQAMINKLGVEKFNRYKQKEFESNNVKLPDGNWISLETYNSSSRRQAMINKLGVEKFNRYKQKNLNLITLSFQTATGLVWKLIIAFLRNSKILQNSRNRLRKWQRNRLPLVMPIAGKHCKT